MSETEFIHLRPIEMKQALEFTASTTGFAPRFLEKDYWCSLILRELYRVECSLVFKGGTLLTKAFTGFDRLSEDLDFTLPTQVTDSRSVRSQRAKKVKGRFDQVAEDLDLTWIGDWVGHNNSKQYRGRLQYPSVLEETESVLVEVGQREAILTQAVDTPLETLLKEPLFQEPAVAKYTAKTLSLEEAYAEKLRAALTREPAAIRDLYDIWLAHRLGLLPNENAEWLNLVQLKSKGLDLAQALSISRVQAFKAGIKTELVPMLRSESIRTFHFERAVELLDTMLHDLLSIQQPDIRP
jgi:predicted nucleotidyltransferase component of viral defense system